MKSSRIIIYDLIKVLMTFLVVNLHVESFVVQAPFTALYYLGWYAVPIFITLTFYFSTKYYLNSSLSLADFIKKLSRFILPFIFWSVVGFLIHNDLISPKYILRQLVTGTAVDPPLYYLLLVGWVSVFVYIARIILTVKNRYLILVAIFVLLLVESTGLEQNLISLYLPIQIQLTVIRLLEFVKYALLGLSLDIYGNYIRSKRAWFMFPLTILMVTSDVLYKWWFQVTSLGYSGIIQFTVVVFIMLTALTFENHKWGTTMSNIIAKLASYSLGVYCLHTFFIEKVLTGGVSLVISVIIIALSYFTSFLIDTLTAKRLRVVVS